MSHCGIIIKRQGVFTVIHTISGSISKLDGIRQCTLSEFIQEADKGGFKIVRPVFSYDKDKAVDTALTLLEEQIPFDNSFTLDNGNQLYCSELIRTITLEAGSPDVFHYKVFGTNRVIDMSSFSDSCLFTVVLPLPNSAKQ